MAFVGLFIIGLVYVGPSLLYNVYAFSHASYRFNRHRRIVGYVIIAHPSSFICQNELGYGT